MEKIFEVQEPTVYIKHDNWVRYEFSTKEGVSVHEEENFGLEILTTDDSIKMTVCVVGEQDYWVYDDVTQFFDVEKLISAFKKVDTAQIDHSKEYTEWLVTADEE